MTALAHMPVLLGEVVEALQPRDGGIYVDGTFGAGGYTRAILAARQCSVIAIDRDPTAIEGGKALVAQSHGRLTLIEGCFGDMAELLCEHDIRAVDGVALDVGVSSMQIDDGARGFSFMKDGPLDMRMSSGGRMSKGGTEAGASAGDVVNTMPEAVLRNIITIYGEERRARTIARAIVAARNAKPFTSTSALADVVARAAGPAAKASGIHPATRTFQALRIYVNDELGELSRGLCAAERLLKPQGRLAVVSFHSLEDRIVKKFMAERSQVEDTGSRHAPPKKMRAPSFVLVARGGITPGESETSANPRARSARLRVAERTHAAPHPIASSSHHTLPGIEVKP